MVWAPIWLPKPSRRPSRRHPKKKLNFDTYFLLIFGCFGDPLEHPKSQKNVRTHPCGGPILAPKTAREENEAPRYYFEAFCIPKSVFWQRFLSGFCILLGSRTSNSIRHKLPNDAVPKQICIPIVHLPNMRLNHALPNMRPNHVLAKYASQSCTCQICIPNVHLPNMHPKRALIKYASQACTCQICISNVHLPNT